MDIRSDRFCCVSAYRGSKKEVAVVELNDWTGPATGSIGGGPQSVETKKNEEVV